MMRRVFSVLMFLLLGSIALSAEPLKVEIVGHRGASFDAPENTVAAIKLAWEQRADASEFDIYLSKDQKIVGCHDKDTKRTAGVKHVVAETLFDELRKLDVGSWKNAKYQGERIPTLDELLDTVPPGKKVYIEVKCGPEIVPELVRILDARKLPPAQTPMICFNADVVAAFKKARPANPSYWLVSLNKKSSVDAILAKAKDIHADGLDLSANEFLDEAFAKKILDAGLRLDVYTVNDVAVAKRMLKIGVHGITTDRPGWLREQLAQ